LTEKNQTVYIYSIIFQLHRPYIFTLGRPLKTYMYVVRGFAIHNMFILKREIMLSAVLF
jgi:hypothetical protein